MYADAVADVAKGEENLHSAIVVTEAATAEIAQDTEETKIV